MAISMPRQRIRRYGTTDASAATGGNPTDPNNPPTDPNAANAQPPGPTAGSPGVVDTRNFGGAPSYSPDLTSTDPYKMMQQNRLQDINQGQSIDQSLRDQQYYQQQLEGQYRPQMNQAYSNLQQTPGFTADESAAINREPQFNALLNTDYSGNYLTPQEQQSIQGNPYAAMAAYNPGSTDQIINDANAQTNAAMNQQETGINQTVANTASQLSPSQGYNTAMGNVLDTTSNRVQGAVNNQNLQMSQDYARQAGMTDQEVAQTAQLANMAAGDQYRAAIGDIERQAAESGQVSPLAVAAAKNRLLLGSAGAQAEATANAQLAARAQQRQAATGVESTRLGTAQDIAGRQTQAGLALGQMGQQAATQGEQMRIQGAQTAGQMALQGQEYTGSSRLANEQANANRSLQANQFGQQFGAGLLQYGEGQQAQRAGQVAENRQSVNFANQGAQFQRGFGVNQQLSGTAMAGAQARMGGQQEYRNWATGQTNQANQTQLGLNQQRIGNFGTQAGAVNQATGQYGQYDLGRRGMGFGTAFKGSFGSSFGKVLGGAPGYGYGG